MAPQRQTGDQADSTAVADEASLRCHCGSLLARLVPDGVELKCRRCKRQVVVRFATEGTVRIDM